MFTMVDSAHTHLSLISATLPPSLSCQAAAVDSSHRSTSNPKPQTQTTHPSGAARRKPSPLVALQPSPPALHIHAVWTVLCLALADRLWRARGPRPRRWISLVIAPVIPSLPTAAPLASFPLLQVRSNLPCPTSFSLLHIRLWHGSANRARPVWGDSTNQSGESDTHP